MLGAVWSSHERGRKGEERRKEKKEKGKRRCHICCLFYFYVVAAHPIRCAAHGLCADLLQEEREREEREKGEKEKNLRFLWFFITRRNPTSPAIVQVHHVSAGKKKVSKEG